MVTARSASHPCKAPTLEIWGSDVGRWCTLLPLTPAHTVLPMARSQLSSFRPQVSPSRLLAHIHLLFHLKGSLEAAGSPSHPVNVPAPPDLSIPESFPTDPAALCDLLNELTFHLQSWLPDRQWLEGAIKFVGNGPVDTGEVANIYLGMRGNRKVIIKCYRFYPSDYFPTYMVGVLRNLWVLSRLLKNSSVEISSRGIGLRSLQEPELCAVHRCLVHPPVSNVPRLRAHGSLEPPRVSSEERTCWKARTCAVLSSYPLLVVLSSR